MKQIYIFTSIVALLSAVSTRADDDLPKRLNFDRYEGMLKRSPFAVASAVAAPAATPDFAKDLYVANAARTPEMDLVTIGSSADKNMKEYLSTKAPNERGYGIANIEWSDRPGATKVTISKDGKFATLTFNQALLSSQSPNLPGVQPQPQQPQPQQPIPQPQGGFPKPAPMPTGPTAPAHSRGVIQRNPTQQYTPAPVPPIPQAEP